MKIKIISKGSGFTTEVFNCDGTRIEGVTKVVIDPIVSDCLVTARLTFEVVELEIEAEVEDNEPIIVPWGEWNTAGYWWPNRLLMMSPLDQYNENKNNNYKMILTWSLQNELFGGKQ